MANNSVPVAIAISPATAARASRSGSAEALRASQRPMGRRKPTKLACGSNVYEVYNANEGERAILTTIATQATVAAEPLALGRAIATAADDKKAEDTLLLDLRKMPGVADFFVICSAASERQLDAIADHVRKTAREAYGISPRGMEGSAGSGWMLLDYGFVVVHIMTPRLRAYYGLETLWAAAPVLLRLQ